MEKKETLNLYQKLLDIQKKIMWLKKDSQWNNYKYVSWSKVLEYIKPIMNEHWIILKQEILDIENTRQDYKTKNWEKEEILSKVFMRFTWIDCATWEKDENLFWANGQNWWDKWVWSALTYWERYFLLKFFHIDTDEDDLDVPNSESKENHKPIPEKERVRFEDKHYIKFTQEYKKHLEKYPTAESMIKMLDVQYILSDEYKNKIVEFYKTIK